MYEYVYKYIRDGDSYFAKKQKTGKRTHFAVTKGGETTYKEFLCHFGLSVQNFVGKSSKPFGLSTCVQKLFMRKTNPFSLELIGDEEVTRNFGDCRVVPTFGPGLLAMTCWGRCGFFC